MARKLLACCIGSLSGLIVPLTAHSQDVAGAVVRLDRPATPVAAPSQRGYVRIDPAQLAANPGHRPAATPRPSSAPVAAAPPTRSNPQAASTGSSTSSRTQDRRAGGPSSSARPARTASAAPVTPPRQDTAPAPQTRNRATASRPATPPPQSRPALLRDASLRDASLGSDLPAPELALFEELAPFAANPANAEAAPWQKIGAPYEAGGTWFIPAVEPDYDETGRASWYGPGFHGRPTANGEIFDQTVPTAAHPTLPIPSYVQVTNLANGRAMIVRVNDRGPFIGDRVIDLSARAAELLGYKDEGTAEVRVRYVGPAPAEPLVTAANLAPTPRAGATPPNRSSRDVARPAPTGPATANANRTTPTPAASGTARRQEAHGTGAVAGTGTGTMTGNGSRAAGGAVTIQLGAFSSRANAERAQRQAAGLGDLSIRETSSNGRPLYRLVLSARDQAAADQARERASAMGLGAVVIAALD
jgi:rare lipoprotein A